MDTTVMISGVVIIRETALGKVVSFKLVYTEPPTALVLEPTESHSLQGTYSLSFIDQW